MSGPGKGARRPWPMEIRKRLLEMVDAGTPCAVAADELGVPRATAHQWVTDPDGSRARERKRRYDMECVDCGGWVSGCEGRRETPRCQRCANLAAAQARTAWTRDLVIARIREWADRHGEPPAQPDWAPFTARHQLHDEARARRFEEADGYWPTLSTVVRIFGKWNAAITAAGFAARPMGGGGGNELRRRTAA